MHGMHVRANGFCWELLLSSKLKYSFPLIEIIRFYLVLWAFTDNSLIIQWSVSETYRPLNWRRWTVNLEFHKDLFYSRSVYNQPQKKTESMTIVDVYLEWCCCFVLVVVVRLCKKIKGILFKTKWYSFDSLGILVENTPYLYMLLAENLIRSEWDLASNAFDLTSNTRDLSMRF